MHEGGLACTMVETAEDGGYSSDNIRPPDLDVTSDEEVQDPSDPQRAITLPSLTAKETLGSVHKLSKSIGFDAGHHLRMSAQAEYQQAH
eukprot:g390.t1